LSVAIKLTVCITIFTFLNFFSAIVNGISYGLHNSWYNANEMQNPSNSAKTDNFMAYV